MNNIFKIQFLIFYQLSDLLRNYYIRLAKSIEKKQLKLRFQRFKFRLALTLREMVRDRKKIEIENLQTV